MEPTVAYTELASDEISPARKRKRPAERLIDQSVEASPPLAMRPDASSNTEAHYHVRTAEPLRQSSVASHMLRAVPLESDEEMLCCGMIDKVSCQLTKNVPAFIQSQLDGLRLNEKFACLALDRKTDRYQVLMDKIPIADLNNRVAAALMELESLNHVQFVIYVCFDQLSAIFQTQASSKNTKRIWQISINVYCKGPELRKIGTVLSDRGIYLQDPDWKEATVEYRNPHIITFTDLTQTEIWLNCMTMSATSDTDDPQRRDWGVVLDHLPQRTSSDVDRQQPLILVPLLQHQCHGLKFMLSRELGDLDESLRYWRSNVDNGGHSFYKHVVTKTEIENPSAEPKGGIIADDMGLGKTLTALACIAASRGRSYDFRDSTSALSGQDTWSRSKATLIVLPSEVISHQWVEEIKSKLKPNAVHYAIYHGQDRARHHSELLDQDIVFTTYGTVAKERARMRARDILYRIEWFRIVLDEAHMIRSSQSKQSIAVNSLQAKHRWCLTGTPISNKIDDLEALVRFCRVPLLEDRAQFREYVIKASKRSFRAGCDVVQRTLSPICLRRSKQLLNLPEPTVTLYSIEFSESEARYYANIINEFRIRLDRHVSGHGNVKHSMLRMILQLRIFCNQGTLTESVDSATEDSLDPDEALTMLQQNDNAKCFVCSQDVLIINQAQDINCGVLSMCSHVLCRLCFDDAANAVEAGVFACPQCSQEFQPADTQAQRCQQEPDQVFECHSSKLEKLLGDLSVTATSDKSLVLSCWKKTIDMVSMMCTKRSINFVQIDGTITQSVRTKLLNKFVTDDQISVLLMTMGTGALGLNLTAATRIHILEPQWNPAVEEQAIGRLVRIGQNKSVDVVRYVVKGSIEEQIQIYQRRKVQLIAGGFGDSSEESVEAQTALLNATFFQE